MTAVGKRSSADPDNASASSSPIVPGRSRPQTSRALRRPGRFGKLHIDLLHLLMKVALSPGSRQTRVVGASPLPGARDDDPTARLTRRTQRRIRVVVTLSKPQLNLVRHVVGRHGSQRFVRRTRVARIGGQQTGRSARPRVSAESR